MKLLNNIVANIGFKDIMIAIYGCAIKTYLLTNVFVGLCVLEYKPCVGCRDAGR